MAKVLAVLCSGRRHGYTATVMEAALEGAREKGAEVEVVHLREFTFGPCISCFECIRRKDHTCVLPDDMGREGKGRLFVKVREANALLLADAVHMWGPTASAHLFIERLYPFVWSGELNGMPFSSVSCATNQGMQHLATAEICKWAFTLGMRHTGALSVHAARFERALKEAKVLGGRLAEAALKDEKGRRRYRDDIERFLDYADKPWSPLLPYLENLTKGTLTYEGSLLEEALCEGTFKDERAVELLTKAAEGLKRALKCYKLGDLEGATRALVEASAYWTHATWREFLEREVIRAKPPKVYRPLPRENRGGGPQEEALPE